ncbi:ArsR family transcriptional regulator [Streptomyces sp. HNM0574]|nr:ArsR family transcriptional regulator [Streptomyces sp. HNM0574]
MKKTGTADETRQAATPAPAQGVASSASGVPAQQDEQQHGTRNKVARSILDHGPSTAAELASRLGLTQAAVRRHLDTLLGEGVVEPRDKRVYGSRGRGRPAKVFALTDGGRDAFDQHYDELAADALRWIARSAGGGEAGEAAVAAFARDRIAEAAERYRERLADVPPEEQARALAEALTADGYAATARSAPASAGGPSGQSPGGEQLCQHHCPVAHTAEQFPQLCEAETELFSRLLGTHVQRLATIAHGDGVCTTFIPRAHPTRTTSTNTEATNASAKTAGRNPA